MINRGWISNSSAIGLLFSSAHVLEANLRKPVLQVKQPWCDSDLHPPGPYLKHAFAKSVHKGEDFWLQQRAISTNDVGAATFDAFGIFDGHGGKLAAQYASKNLVNHVVGALDGISPSPDVTAPVEEQLQQLMTKELADSTSQLVSDVDKQAWRAQDVLVDKLPQALSRGFEETQKDFWSRSKVSGTTATVVALVGWEVVVANVGDSCAVLDTGSEVVQISGNHRLEDNKAEQRRCTDAGCDISTSVLEGKNVGPLRVWPGGLAMSRTIGDYDAGEVVLAEPEVRQVTLPHTGGRIIIASDGLWDAVSLKTAAHHVRGLPASKAANDLVQMSLKSRGLRDDITVLVVDTMPSQEGRLPPLLARHNTGHGLAFPDEQADAVTIHKPLEADSHVPWRKFVWERRAAAVEAALAPRRASRPMDISPDASQCSSGTHVSDSLLSASTSPGDAMSLADTVGSLMSDGMPDTYRELADLKAVPFNFQSAIIPEAAEARLDAAGDEAAGLHLSAALLRQWPAPKRD
ncbi:hypothetical protein WJX72_000281 [[Myrmecia] bisecta]|uniref:PPM-type phosphatase domain-containing protein n=1 Tax=[Myrmecia] bisecta TaxID=41462 RepID=A0AAW1Q0W2_9CHLO